MIYRI